MHNCLEMQPRVSWSGRLLPLVFVAAIHALLPARAQEQSRPIELSGRQAEAILSEKSPKDETLEEGSYYVVGSVIEEGSKQPIAGAGLRFLIDGEPNPDKKLVSSTPDDKGRFQVEVPIGNLRVWFPAESR